MENSDSKLSILIVDDDPGILETMVDILLEKDFKVAAASDGFKAIELVKERHFDAIIMDVRMPGMDGVETFKRMKEIKRASKTIFMTAYALEDLIREAKTEGATTVLLKPIDIDALVNLLRVDNQHGCIDGTRTFC